MSTADFPGIDAFATWPSKTLQLETSAKATIESKVVPALIVIISMSTSRLRAQNHSELNSILQPHNLVMLFVDKVGT